METKTKRRKKQQAAKMPKELGGPEGLVLAVIYRAVLDAGSSKPDIAEPARQWFDSEDYKFYCDCLGILPGTKPKGIKTNEPIRD